MNYTQYYKLQKPLSNEKYNVAVQNTNADLIDSALNRIELKNKTQDELLSSKTDLKAHTDDEENPHKTTKSQVGLSNVTNDRQIKGLATESIENNLLIFGTDGYTVKDSGYAAQDATIDQIGLVQLEDSIESDSITKAATPNSVKRALLQSQTAISNLSSVVNEKVNASDLTAHENDHTIHITDAERTKWNSEHTHNYAGSSSPGGPATTALNCTGNSATATKATQDASGNVLTTTYASSATISGQNILLKSKSGATLSTLSLSGLSGGGSSIIYTEGEPSVPVKDQTWISATR